MAKKRLNKKLVLILASLFGIILIVGICVAFNAWNRDPKPYNDKAKLFYQQAMEKNAAIIKTAQAIDNPQLAYEKMIELRAEEGSYDELIKESIRNYKRAWVYTQDSLSDKCQIGMDLADLYHSTHEYRGALQTWAKLLDVDGTYIPALDKLVDYYYVAAQLDSEYQPKVLHNWTELEQYVVKWMKLEPGKARNYLLKIQSDIQSVKNGVDENYQQTLSVALKVLTDYERRIIRLTQEGGKPILPDTETLLERLRWFDSSVEGREFVENAGKIDDDSLKNYSVLLYHLLGKTCQAFVDNLSEPELKQQFATLAFKYYQQGKLAHPGDIQAYRYYYDNYLLPSVDKKYRAILTTNDVSKQALLTEAAGVAYDDAILEVDEMIQQFPDSSDVYHFKAKLLELNNLFTLKFEMDLLDQIVQQYEKAYQLEPDHLQWSRLLSENYYRRYFNSVTPDLKDLTEAFRLLQNSIYSLDVVLAKGPRYVEVINERMKSLKLQVDVSTLLYARTEDTELKDECINVARKSYAELRDHLGENNFHSKIAFGTLSLAQGDVEIAQKNFYEVDNELKLQNVLDANLYLKLFYVFRESENKSLSLQYGNKCIQMGVASPKIFHDVIETFLQTPSGRNAQQLTQLVELYERLYDIEGPLKNDLLIYKTRAFLGMGELDKAREVFNQITVDNFQVQQLRVTLQGDVESRVSSLERLIESHPADEALVRVLYAKYMQDGKQDASKYDKARSVVLRAIDSDPENIVFKQMLNVLSQDDPGVVDEDRLRLSFLESLKEIKDPLRRDKQLGDYYFSEALRLESENTEAAQLAYQEAGKYYADVFSSDKSDLTVLEKAYLVKLSLKKVDEAKELLSEYNQMDPIESLRLEGQLHLHNQQWSQAIDVFQRYLAERPISVDGHIGLATAYEKNGQLEDGIKEIKEAIKLDSSNISAQRKLLVLLHQKNYKKNVSEISMSDIQYIVGVSRNLVQFLPNDVQVVKIGLIYQSLYNTKLNDQLKANTALSTSNRKKVKDEIEKNHNNIINGWEQLVSKNPGDVLNWTLLVNAYSQFLTLAGEDDAVMETHRLIESVYQRAMQANPNSDVLVMNYAKYKRSIGMIEQSDQIIQDLIDNSSGEKKHNLQLQLAQISYDEKNHEKVNELVDAVLGEDSDNTLAIKLKAENLVAQNQISEAISVYQQLLLDANEKEVVLRMIHLMLFVNRLDDVEKTIESARASFGDLPEIKLKQARLEIQRSNYANAVAIADEIIEQAPSVLEAYDLKSQALMYDQKIFPAIQVAKELRERVGAESVVGRSLLAQLYQLQAQYDDAINEYRAILRLTPDAMDARDKLMKLYQSTGQWQELEALNNETIQLYPEVVLFYISAAKSLLSYGDVLMKGGRTRLASDQYTKSFALVKKALELNNKTSSDIAQSNELMCQLLLKMGRFQEVVNIVDSIEAAGGMTSTYYMFKALSLKGLGNQQAALDNYAKGLALPQDNMVFNAEYISNILAVQPDIDLALSWGQGKINENPSWVSMHELMGHLYRIKGLNEEMFSSYLLAIQYTQNQLKKIHLMNRVSVYYLSDGQLENAIAIAEKVLEINPDQLQALNNLAYFMLGDEDRVQQAIQYAKRAYDAASTNPDIMDTYALALIKTEAYAEAEIILRQAILLKNRKENYVGPEFYYHLGQALEGTGKLSSAQDQLMYALQLFETKTMTNEDKKLKKEIEEMLLRISS